LAPNPDWSPIEPGGILGWFEACLASKLASIPPYSRDFEVNMKKILKEK